MKILYRFKSKTCKHAPGVRISLPVISAAKKNVDKSGLWYWAAARREGGEQANAAARQRVRHGYSLVQLGGKPYLAGAGTIAPPCHIAITGMPGLMASWSAFEYGLL
jgi:hypothetical protein